MLPMKLRLQQYLQTEQWMTQKMLRRRLPMLLTRQLPQPMLRPLLPPLPRMGNPQQLLLH
jgi:hypothetical protein